MISILSIGEAIEEAMRSLSYNLSSLIYELVAYIYEIFLKLTSARILDSEVLDAIASRIGLVLGIIMFFVVIMSAIQMILEPDNLTNKEKGLGNIVKKIVLVVVMLGVSNSAFRALYGLQTTIIDSNIIHKFLIPYEFNKENFGNMLSAELFTAFYHLDERMDEETQRDCNYKAIVLYSEIVTEKNYSIGKECLNARANGQDGTENFIIYYNWLLSPLIGVGAVYFIFYYCISIGLRTIQLAFLEIISPMAIISYLSPKKETMFSKWMKYYTATYIDIFIRVAIINLSVFLIAIVFDNDMSLKFWDSIGGKAGNLSDIIITIIITFALLTFAKKAPELLKDLFPSAGKGLGFGIKSPKAMFGDMLGGDLVKKTLTGAAGLGIGAVTGGLGNALRGGINAARSLNPKLNGWQKFGEVAGASIGGLFGGIGSGLTAGATAKGVLKSFGASNKAAKAQAKKIADWRAAGGTSTIGRWGTGIQQRFGVKTKSERIDDENKILEDYNKSLSDFVASFDKIDKRMESKILDGSFGENENAQKTLAAKREIEVLQNELNNLRNKCLMYDSEGNVLGVDEDRYEYEKIEINKKMNAMQVEYKDSLKAAKTDYYATKREGENVDAVLVNELSKTQATLSNEKAFAGLNINIEDFKSFDTTNGTVQTRITENTNTITSINNREETRAARANQKYSGGQGSSK